jgi:hypothetical protein
MTADKDMVDRASRDRMIQTIRSYMDEEITSDQFDDALAEISRATSDEGVSAVRQELWYVYDDLTDHPIVAYKHDWDYLNRLLLLLSSNAEIAVERVWCTRHVPQGIAAFALAIYGFLVIRSGFTGTTLLILALPFGLITLGVARLRTWQNRILAAIEPFPSVRSLFAVRRSASGFIRRRYPQSRSARKVRGPVVRVMLWFYEIAIVAVLSPVLLLIQALPQRESRVRISDV